MEEDVQYGNGRSTEGAHSAQATSDDFQVIETSLDSMCEALVADDIAVDIRLDPYGRRLAGELEWLLELNKNPCIDRLYCSVNSRNVFTLIAFSIAPTTATFGTNHHCCDQTTKQA